MGNVDFEDVIKSLFWVMAELEPDYLKGLVCSWWKWQALSQLCSVQLPSSQCWSWLLVQSTSISYYCQFKDTSIEQPYSKGGVCQTVWKINYLLMESAQYLPHWYWICGVQNWKNQDQSSFFLVGCKWIWKYWLFWVCYQSLKIPCAQRTAVEES